MKFQLFILINFVVLFANAQSILVEHMTSSNVLDADGLFYALPNTVLRAKLSVKQTIFKKGPNYQNIDQIFTESAIEDKNIPAARKTTALKYDLEDIALNTKAIPDFTNI